MSHTTERLGALTRQRKMCPAGESTYILLDTNAQNPVTVFIRNNASAHAVTADITPDDAADETPVLVPMNIGTAGSIDAGSSAACELKTPIRAVIVHVPAEASAAAEIVVLK
jgi:hypothetical protein